MNEVESVLDDYFGDVEENPTGEGLSVKDAQKLLMSEMNSLIKTGNVIRMRKTRGLAPLVPAFKGLRQINQIVFMARQKGSYGPLLASCGYGRG